jgi:hypothetical protein
MTNQPGNPEGAGQLTREQWLGEYSEVYAGAMGINAQQAFDDSAPGTSPEQAAIDDINKLTGSELTVADLYRHVGIPQSVLADRLRNLLAKPLAAGDESNHAYESLFSWMATEAQVFAKLMEGVSTAKPNEASYDHQVTVQGRFSGRIKRQTDSHSFWLIRKRQKYGGDNMDLVNTDVGICLPPAIGILATGAAAGNIVQVGLNERRVQNGRAIRTTYGFVDFVTPEDKEKIINRNAINTLADSVRLHDRWTSDLAHAAEQYATAR